MPFYFIKKITEGYLSNNFILKNDHQKYFLKQYRFGEKYRIEEIHKAKELFHKYNIPLIFPLKTRLGKTYFSFQGNHYALFPFIQGKMIKHKSLSPAGMRSVGRLLAAIHLVSKEKCPRIIKPRSFRWDLNKLAKNTDLLLKKIAKKKSGGLFDKKARYSLLLRSALAERLTFSFEEFRFKNTHIMHGDFHQRNMFFDRKGEVTHIYDWEKINQSPREIELARALEFFCFYGNHLKNNYELASVFLKEYSKYYPFQKNALANGIRAWYGNQLCTLWIEDNHYLKNNFRTDCFLEGHIKFLEYYSKNLEKHIRLVTSNLRP